MYNLNPKELKFYEVATHFIANVEKQADLVKRTTENITKKKEITVAVCGSFSTGKSSLINALLGCKLPTGLNPITKRTIRVIYTEKNRSKIFLRNPKNGETKEISEETANSLITNELDNTYKDWDIYCEINSPLLKKGIVFVDTPGFEDDSAGDLDEITKKAIQESDFCIVNFSCNQFGTKNERQFLEDLQRLTNGNFTVVLNCKNYVMANDSVDELNRRAGDILRGFGNDIIGYGEYFVVQSENRKLQITKNKSIEMPIDLDGFDKWLLDNVIPKSREIKSDTAASKMRENFSGRFQIGLDLISRIDDEVVSLQKEDIDNHEKKVQNIRTTPTDTILKFRKYRKEKKFTFCKTLEWCVSNELRKLSAEEFNDKAFEAIEAGLSSCFHDLKGETMSLFRGVDNISYHFGGVKMQCTKATLLHRENKIWEKIFGGEYYYNDYFSGTMDDLREVTIPEAFQRAENYLDDVENRLFKLECMDFQQRNKEKISKYISLIDEISVNIMEYRKILYSCLNEIEAG